MKCHDLEHWIPLLLHGELPDEHRQQLEHHAAACESCQRRLAFEQVFEARLRSLPPAPAPPGLEARLRAGIPRPARPRLRALVLPLAWASSGALAALLVLWLRGSPARLPDVRVGGEGELVGKIVCMACTLRPETVPLHRANREFDHLNALLDDSGRLWNIANTREQHALLTDDGLEARRVQVVGMLFPSSGTIVLRSMSELTAAGPGPHLQDAALEWLAERILPPLAMNRQVRTE